MCSAHVTASISAFVHARGTQSSPRQRQETTRSEVTGLGIRQRGRLLVGGGGGVVISWSVRPGHVPTRKHRDAPPVTGG